MENDAILQTTTIVLVFLSTFFAFFLLTVQSKNKIGNILLAVYLLIRSLDISSFFYHNYIKVNPTWEMLRMDISSYSLAPLLYLYILSAVYSDFELEKRHLFHAVPLIIITLVQAPNFYLAGFSNQIEFLNNYTESFEGILSFYLSLFQNLGYIIAVFILLKKYKKLLLENYSFSGNQNHDWLFQLNVILSLLLLVVFVKNVYKFTVEGDAYAITLYRICMIIALLIFTCWVVLKAMYAPKLFRGIETGLQLVSALKDKTEYDVIRIRINTLKKYMSIEEPFLNSELTIKQLSNKLQLKEQELSILINRHLNRNFYDFVNEYRIEKAKEILKNALDKKLTILEILYKVGFNSKSSFNTFFKKQTGITPTQYRRKHLLK